MSKEMRCFAGMEREAENHHGSWTVDWPCKGLTCHSVCLGCCSPASLRQVTHPRPATSYPTPPPLAVLYNVDRKISEA